MDSASGPVDARAIQVDDGRFVILDCGFKDGDGWRYQPGSIHELKCLALQIVTGRSEDVRNDPPPIECHVWPVEDRTKAACPPLPDSAHDANDHPARRHG